MEKTSFDAASGLSQGARSYQEDAVVADAPLGSDVGLIVLSDGMGGHAAGDVASKIVMTEVYSELKFQSGKSEAFDGDAPTVLRSATDAANDCLRAHVEHNPEARGMGATLIAAVVAGNQLHWVSVGDSPLFLYRDGKLKQLNEDHSMAPQIDQMVATGIMSKEDGRDHPDRNCLTSVLNGSEIARVDCPVTPTELQEGDILLAASDGLQFLHEDDIRSVLHRNRETPSAWIAQALLEAIHVLDDPDQDNVSMAVVRIGADTEAPVQPRQRLGDKRTVLPRRVVRDGGKVTRPRLPAGAGPEM